MDARMEDATRRRYSEAARTVAASLCCPQSYDPRWLAAIPDEVLARDYGCGNPTRFLRSGEVVLDLGSGSGKNCFIASQLVGRDGRVLGIDMNDEMLDLARRNTNEVARRVGFGNVTFKKGRIQDLGLDLELLDRHLAEHPVQSIGGLAEMEAVIGRLRQEQPLVASESVDVVTSNCVLNLVRAQDKAGLFAEIYRVLKAGGRAVIADIVSDEQVPEQLTRDPELWSGCVSGALQEERFLEMFEQQGFHGLTVIDRQQAPWRVIDGIEFRSATIVAYKGKEGPCLDQKHAVVYRGPFREVLDDDGHLFRRGVRTAVCEKTFRLFSREPYCSHVELIPPRMLVPLSEAPPFSCSNGSLRRHPRETKGSDYQLTSAAQSTACHPGNGTGGACC